MVLFKECYQKMQECYYHEKQKQNRSLETGE